MPLYEYRCTSCGYSFEKIQSFSAQPETVCPKCEGVLIRPVTAPALRFEGAGWYVNDYAGKGGAKKGEGSGEAGKAAEGSSAADSKSESKSDSATGSTDSKPAAPTATTTSAPSSAPSAGASGS